MRSSMAHRLADADHHHSGIDSRQKNVERQWLQVLLLTVITVGLFCCRCWANWNPTAWTLRAPH